MRPFDVKWPSISISDTQPGHSSRTSIIRALSASLVTNLLNECKFFPYNQLSNFSMGPIPSVAQRVHFGTPLPPGEMQRWPTPQRVSSTPVEELPADILRLAAAIHAIPEQYSRDLLPALERVVESTKRRRRILSMVQDALSQLRLDMKYLMFDVEATRRERDEFQARLEEFEVTKRCPQHRSTNTMTRKGNFDKTNMIPRSPAR